MQPYRNRKGRAGISFYQSSEKSITLRFIDGSTYLYTHRKPGRSHVEAMKRLALEGKGLTTYVNQHVRDHYARRLA